MGGGGGRLHVVVSRNSDRCSNVCEKVERKKKQTERKGGNTEGGGGRGSRGSGGRGGSLTEKIPASNLRIGYLCSVRIYLGDSADLTGPTSVWWHINQSRPGRAGSPFGPGEGFDEVGRQRLEAAALKGVLGRQSAETPNSPPPGLAVSYITPR